MSRHTRLDRIERDLSPDERVFVWLADAHAFGSHDAYVDWLLDRPEDEHPGHIADELLTRGRRGRRGRAGPDRTAIAAAQRADLLVLLAIELDGRVRVELPASPPGSRYWPGVGRGSEIVRTRRGRRGTRTRSGARATISPPGLMP